MASRPRCIYCWYGLLACDGKPPCRAPKWTQDEIDAARDRAARLWNDLDLTPDGNRVLGGER